MTIWGDFQGLTGVTRGGRGGQKIGVTSFMDGPYWSKITYVVETREHNHCSDILK